MDTAKTQEFTGNIEVINGVEVAPPIERPFALASNLAEFFRAKGLKYKVLGRADFPESISYVGNWVIVPSDIDASHIPDHAMDKVSLIHAHGFRPKGFLLVHELSKKDAKTPPAGSFSVPQAGWFSQKPTPSRSLVTSADIRQVMRQLTPVVDFGLALAKVALVCAGIALAIVFLFSILKVIFIGLAVLAGLFILGSAAGLDPVLVVVSDDNYWIEIDRWVA